MQLQEQVFWEASPEGMGIKQVPALDILGAGHDGVLFFAICSRISMKVSAQQSDLCRVGLHVESLGTYLTWTTATEKAMAPHSSTLAWKIPWMEEPGGLQSMGSLRVGQDWATSLSLFTFMHWRRKWQPTPVFLPGESQEQGNLVGCRPWGCTESDMTEVT